MHKEPKYGLGERVAKKTGPHSGRVQSITYDGAAKQFRYIVKWDNGPTTSHLEDELVHEQLPEHYP